MVMVMDYDTNAPWVWLLVMVMVDGWVDGFIGLHLLGVEIYTILTFPPFPS
jgi:hypothetical protein